MICVLIITPIPALRAGLRALLSGEPGYAQDPEIRVVGAAAALAGMPDFPVEEGVLITTPEGLDEQTIELLARQEGWTVLLVGDDPAAAILLARQIPQGRAWGMVSTEVGPEALQAALAALSEGLSVASAGVMAQVMAKLPAERVTPEITGPETGDGGLPPENLTERETNVLRLAAEGLTNKQIAFKLGISEHTVKFHISAIYAKFGVSNRAEAVRKGARWGWVPL